MNSLRESFGLIFGNRPARPKRTDISEAAQKLHEQKRGLLPEDEAASLEEAKIIHRKKTNWRRKRWSVLISANLLFVLSYWLDIQALEGALTGSRFVGFHLADLNASLQVMLAFKQVLINLIIGTITIFIVWWTLGGRTFCSWICPYHLLGEWAEILHNYLLKKGWAKEYTFNRKTRTWLWLAFAVLAFVSSYTVFETISPTGILSRALIYGPGLALLWVLFLLLFEIFFSRRAWCRYACPIGLTYGIVGATSPMKVQYNLTNCQNDGECRKVCMVPHVLHMTKPQRATDTIIDIGADCTRCGRCVEVCPTHSLTFKFKGLHPQNDPA